VPEAYRWIIRANPMSAIIETFRAIYLGGTVPWLALGVSALVTLAVLAAGIVLFNRVEKSFMDTV
jgi:lipopolysaccharide transport system permease protein